MTDSPWAIAAAAARADSTAAIRRRTSSESTWSCACRSVLYSLYRAESWPIHWSGSEPAASLLEPAAGLLDGAELFYDGPARTRRRPGRRALPRS
jgi:hypothetical protein